MAAPSIYNTGTTSLTGSLAGSERVVVDNGGPQIVTVTTQQIANLAGTNTQTANTNITTVGAGTLTAAAIDGRLITRSGPTAAYTDTTDTAAAIVASITNAFVGQSFYISIKNTVPFNQTIAAGTGVTLAGGNTIVPPNSEGRFLVSLTSLTAVTLTSVNTPRLSAKALEAIVGLTTVGAGTITAAGIVAGVTARSGPTAAFTDTTDTAAAIIAAQPNARIGDSWEWTYQNNVNFLATLANGTGVTVSGVTAVPGQTSVRYLVTYTAAATVTIAEILVVPNISLPPAKFSTAALSVAAFTAGAITGADFVVLQNTGATPGAQTVRTAAQMLADIPGGYVGLTVMFRIVNTGAGTLTITADGGATVTLTGTMTIAQNVFRDYALTFNTATTATIQSVGSGVSP